MGEPLLQRAGKEIAWALELAKRLARKSQAPDLSVELRALESLEKRMEMVTARVSARVSAKVVAPQSAMPGWIWHPEGKPNDDAPAATRFFRSKFELPVAVSRAQLRIAAADACEVFINGIRVGTHDTWARAAGFSVTEQLQPGTNVLAVRAENKPANSKNPVLDFRQLLFMDIPIQHVR